MQNYVKVGFCKIFVSCQFTVSYSNSYSPQERYSVCFLFFSATMRIILFQLSQANMHFCPFFSFDNGVAVSKCDSSFLSRFRTRQSYNLKIYCR